MDSALNKRVNHRRKIDPASLDELQSRLNTQKEAVVVAQRVVDGLKNNDGWFALQRLLRDQLESLDSQLDEFHSLTDKGRDFLLAQRKTLKDIVNKVDDFERVIGSLNDDIDATTAELNERKQRLRKDGNTFN